MKQPNIHYIWSGKLVPENELGYLEDYQQAELAEIRIQNAVKRADAAIARKAGELQW